nr:unnamed protein product [Spirometra erinaceieuropaei]
MATTDRGAQFESALFQALLNFLDYTCIQTMGHHPGANGTVELFRQQPKTSLYASRDLTNCYYNLSLVFPGIRSTSRSDLDCSAAGSVFSTTHGLPRKLVTPTSLALMGPRRSCAQAAEASLRRTIRVPSRNIKAYRILRGDKENVVSVDQVRAAVAEEPPDLSQGQDCADPYPVILYLPYPMLLHLFPTSLPPPTLSVPMPMTFAPLVSAVAHTFSIAAPLRLIYGMSASDPINDPGCLEL